VVTPDEMRAFALDCLNWAERADNTSQRDLMLNIGRTWMNMAFVIERRVANGAELESADLRMKLD
jgi:hypothetical protein